MHIPDRFRLPIAVASVVLLGACAESAPVAPGDPAPEQLPAAAQQAIQGHGHAAARALATMAWATVRYHDLDVAKADGFVFLHGCETRGDEGPVGIVYVHMGRLTDGVIDPAKPEALIYEPRKGGKPRLIGVELAMPYQLWTDPHPPTFLGQTFQREDEFGVWGLHVWLWTRNPDGLFAESNPHVDCTE